MSGEGLKKNHLNAEKSMYLLLHANNPIKWFPWGNAAFFEAEKSGKPIFLSIGYTHSHYCHLMEKESFSDHEIAHLMNQNFISIKVDREELPDVDGFYMDFAEQFFSRNGEQTVSWPLNILLTPDRKPFFAVTYLEQSPKQEGALSFKGFLEKIIDLWRLTHCHDLVLQAEEIEKTIQQRHKEFLRHTKPLSSDTFQHFMTSLFSSYLENDVDNAEKESVVPTGYAERLFLNFSKLAEDARGLFCAEKTLIAAHKGLLHDPLKGGFFCCSLDEQWVVPHLEKNLYENVLLGEAFLSAAQYTKDPSYSCVLKHLLKFLIKTLKSPGGGFFSSEGTFTEEEGAAYYGWKYTDLQEILSEKELLLVSLFYGVSPEGDFHGYNLLHIVNTLEEVSLQLHLSLEVCLDLLQDVQEKLLNEREKKKKLSIDDKIILSWNGLIIGLLAQSSSFFEDSSYLVLAEECATFLDKVFFSPKGGVLRRFRKGSVDFPAVLDDFAFLMKGFITLHEHSGDLRWLKLSLSLRNTISLHFKSDEGDYFFSKEKQGLPSQFKIYFDGSEPSGNAVYAESLLRLYHLTGHTSCLEEAQKILRISSGMLSLSPESGKYYLLAWSLLVYPNTTLCIVFSKQHEELCANIRELLGSCFLPNTHILWKDVDNSDFNEVCSLHQDKVLRNGKLTLYYQRGDSKIETSDTQQIFHLIKSL